MFIYYILNGMNWQVCHLFLFAQCNTLFDKEEVIEWSIKNHLCWSRCVQFSETLNVTFCVKHRHRDWEGGLYPLT